MCWTARRKLVEASRLKTGRRSEGLFFAASAFISKATSGLGIFAASIIVAVIALKPGADDVERF